jgi:hypothetical protein
MADEPKTRGLLPFVRHMLVCEHAEPARHNPRRTNIFGVFSKVFLDAESGRFPCTLGFSVYVMLSDCRKSGYARIIVTEAESGEVCYSAAPFRVELSPDPLELYGLVFRISQCVIPRAGVYWIELEFDGVSIGQESIRLNVR